MKPTVTYNIILFLLSTIAFTGCDEDENFNVIYMPQGSEVVNTMFEIDDEPYEIAYNITMVGADFATADVPAAANNIEVRVKVNATLIDVYNQGAGTDYEILPEGSYAFDESAVISRGETGTELKLTITDKSKLEPFKSFLLPLSIDNVTGASLSKYQTSTYFLVTGTAGADQLVPHDRSNWSIAGFSSEEASGEGLDNGHAIHAIDDDDGTFWHSQWQGGEPEPPHYITIDLKESIRVLGIKIDPRNHWQGQPAEIRVEISEDMENWKNGGTINNLMSTQFGSENDLQHQPYSRLLPFIQTGRYVKITVTKVMPDWNNPDATPSNSTHIAEIWVL